MTDNIQRVVQTTSPSRPAKCARAPTSASVVRPKARNKGCRVSRLNEANAFTGGNYTYRNAFACLTECSDDTASSRSSSSSLSYSFLPSPPSFCSSASRIQPPSVLETDNDSSTSSRPRALRLASTTSSDQRTAEPATSRMKSVAVARAS